MATPNDLYKLAKVVTAFERDAEAIYDMCKLLRGSGAPTKVVYPIERVADAMLDAVDAMKETHLLEVGVDENNSRAGTVQ